MRSYRHLTYEERCQICVLLKRGISQTEIARELGVHRSTISRELQRNSMKTGYYYHWAQAQAEERQKKRDSRPRKMTKPLIAFVEDRIREDWSPQQISGWLKHRQEKLPAISHERIYQYVWLDKFRKGTLHSHLRHRGRRYWRRGSCRQSRGRIPDRVDIDQRPAVVEHKSRVGDWELDTIVGPNKQTGALVSMVDRCSKLVRLALVDSCKAEGVAGAIESKLGEYRGKVLTLTMDNGKEFTRHKSFGEVLDAETYFAKPYHSWERGLNEHTNGLVRQYFPKQTDFARVSKQDVERAEERLNNRPRRVLGYRTPLEVFHGPPETLVALAS